MFRHSPKLTLGAVIANICVTLTGYAATSPLALPVARDGILMPVQGDLSAAGLPAMTWASVAWRDYDGDGKPDFALIGTDGANRSIRVYRNEGGGILTAVASCSGPVDGVWTCEGDLSEGVQITSNSPIEAWVRNLTTNITPAESPGIDVLATGPNGSGLGNPGDAGPSVEVHFIGSGHAIIVGQLDEMPGISAVSQAGNGAGGRNGTTLPDWAGGHSAGPGGSGGQGGDVLVESEGRITTAGAEAPGIVALSVGGSGGSGGSGPLGTLRNGASGGRGGNGGAVTVSGNQNITTEGALSHGILALSQGGQGGIGGLSDALTGGHGGVGGDGGAVTVLGTGTIETHGDGSSAIYAGSEGGRGGNGGSGGLLGDGNDGAGGGRGGDVLVDGSWFVATHGDSSSGIVAQSLGGAGGKGGHGGWFTDPGQGGGSGHGGSVTVHTQGSIETSGEESHGIVAQSVGGHAGTGGSMRNYLVRFSAEGGSGGNGGVVTIHNEAAISASGDRSFAILGQSIGGGGGSGGGGFGLFYSEGGEGSAGGAGDSVNIQNSGALRTTGVDSKGIVAQSIGGGGGNGGGSGGIASFGGKGATTSDGGNVSVVNSGNIVTGPSSPDPERQQGLTGSQAIFAQSIGGGGGNGGQSGGWFSFGGSAGGGGDAGNVSVTSTGNLATHDVASSAIQAQSVGGGGGNGGSSVSAGAYVSAAIGGSGGDGGTGGDVDVRATQGSIQTTGDRSFGIQAQSVGGGGGNGGYAVSASVGAQFSASLSLGGLGGPGNEGGDVSVTAGANITTSGDRSHGIFAESAGGGGGSGGLSISLSGAAGASVALGMGGKGGAGSNGDTVTVSSAGRIQTSGFGSYGILAQSVGGGGGDGGYSIGGSISGATAVTATVGGAGGTGGSGSFVSVANQGQIATLGEQSHGIFAQSVGGGGGSAGYSIGGGAGSNSVTLGFGSVGGSGGKGSNVDVSNAGLIGTSGDRSYGILAQSIGGGGGDGGGSIGASLAGKNAVTATFGGIGANGGTGGRVGVTNDGGISTSGDESHAVFAQSVGGGGGSGGLSVALSGSMQNSVSLGLGGGLPELEKGAGSGGAGGAVDVTNAGTIQTSGDRANGVFAQSVGGGGGDGGGSIVGSAGAKRSVSGSLGGWGGSGGVGGDVSVSNEGRIATEGDQSHGVFAQSVGGGGGSGGFSLRSAGSTKDSLTISLGGGGFGASGNTAGTVDVSNAGLISTSGDRSYGILAQSVGGGGGSGGASGSIGGLAGEGNHFSLSVGGFGGEGGHGDDVHVANAGSILTTGTASHGVFAQSVGGGGGDGGSTFAVELPSLGFGGGGAGGNVRGLHAGASIPGASAAGEPGDEDGKKSRSLDLTLTIGGWGGASGNGGLVAVENSGDIATTGALSNGIFAQSVGGGGGSGGTSADYSLPIGGYEEPDSSTISINLGVGGFGGAGGAGDSVRVSNSGDIETSGGFSHGIFAQSVGGGGGSELAEVRNPLPGLLEPSGGGGGYSLTVGGWDGASGDGGVVEISNAGAIATHGLSSHGIFAQSVGGGGGQVGVSTLDVKGASDISLTVGGRAGAAGDGGSVGVANSGSIFTTGKDSHGIFAQSVGGGGGSESAQNEGEAAGGGSEPDTSLVIFTLGGTGGSAGRGGEVDVSNSGDITTRGASSHGIFAQSVGGGGGQGASVDSSEISKLKVSIGGSGGSAGNGGTVGVTNSGAIVTTGDGSFGILAQSVGGGGGVGGDVKGGLGKQDVGYAIGIGGDGTQAGNGGAVTVVNDGDITTLGQGSIGIFAQSVGGGGGLAGGGKFEIPLITTFAGSAGGSGAGGAVSVVQKGDIVTRGDAAHGIYAQSAAGAAGGESFAGAVNLSVEGDILAYGQDANGIMAQSSGGDGNGIISIEIVSGTIQGGTGSSAGVLMMGGAGNEMTNHGTITTVGGVEGIAILATGDANATIDNFGTITGSIDLGGGTNVFDNHAGATFEAGSTIDLGSEGLLTNAGTFSPGGSRNSVTTTLNGDFEQTSTGTFEVSVCGSQLDKLIVADGSATLDGTLKVVADRDAYHDGTTYDIIDGSSVTGTFSDLILPHTAFLDFDVDYVGSGVQLSVDVKSFGTAAHNPVESAIAGYMDSCLPDATGDMARMIGAFQLSTPEQVAEAFATLSPDTYDNLTRGSLQSMRLYQDALAQRMDAARSNPFPGRETPGRMAYEGGNGAWLSGVRQGADQDPSGGYLSHNFTTSGGLGGYERSLGASIIGGSFGFTTTDVDRENDMANGKVDGIAGSVYGGHLWGRSFAHGVVSYAHESYTNRRDVHVGLEERVARGEYNGTALSALVMGGRRFDAGSWGLEPFASVRYAHLSEKGFTEKGAGSVNLIVDSRGTDWLGTDLGIRFSRSFLGERSAFVPELLLSWNHDFGLDDRPIVAAFEGDPSMTFTMDGQDIKRDGATAGVGLSCLTTSGWKASLRYDRVQRSDYQANSLTIRLGSAF